MIKAFPQILKVLYNADCISDQAIIYWAQKGASPQGKGHFIKAAEPLVKVSVSLLARSVIDLIERLNSHLDSFCKPKRTRMMKMKSKRQCCSVIDFGTASQA